MSCMFLFPSQVCDSQRVGKRRHDPAAAPVGSNSSNEALQSHKRRPQCEEGHHGRHAARPDEQGEESGKSRGCVKRIEMTTDWSVTDLSMHH